MDEKMIQLRGLYAHTDQTVQAERLAVLAVRELLPLAELTLLLINGAGLRTTETGKRIVAKLEEIERAAEF